MKFKNEEGYRNTMIVATNQDECKNFIGDDSTFLTGNCDKISMYHSASYTSLTDTYNFTWDDLSSTYYTFKNTLQGITNSREVYDRYNEFIDKLLTHIGKVDFIYIPMDFTLFRHLNLKSIPFVVVSTSNYVQDTGIIQHMEKSARFFSLDIYKDGILEKLLISKKSNPETYCYDINEVYQDLTQNETNTLSNVTDSFTAYSFGSITPPTDSLTDTI